MESQDPTSEWTTVSYDSPNKSENPPRGILSVIKKEIQQQVPKLDDEVLDRFLLNLHKGLAAALEAIEPLLAPKLMSALTEACETGLIKELIDELRQEDGYKQENEGSEPADEVLILIKSEIEKASLKIDAETLQQFLSELESKGLSNALNKIKGDLIPRVWESLQKLCETGPVKELISQLTTSSKTAGSQAVCQIMKEELERQPKFAKLVHSAAEITESLLMNGAEGFLKANPTIPFLSKLEIVYTYFSNEKISAALENSDEEVNQSSRLLKEVEELLALYAQAVDKDELPGILQGFRDNLDLQDFLTKIQKEIAPSKYGDVKMKIEKDTRITEIITELKKPCIARDKQKERSVQAQILERKLKAGQCFIEHCGASLEVEEAEAALQNFCESLDLDKALKEIEQGIPPNKFNKIEALIKSDERIQKAITELKQIQANQGGSGDDEVQIMLKELKAKIWERVSKYLPQDKEIVSGVKQKLLEELDFESTLAYLKENIAPKIFEPMKATLDADTEIGDLIDKAKNLQENATTIIKTKHLEDQIITLLNKYKPQIDDENRWREVQEDLKKNFNVGQSLSLIEELLPPTKYKKLIEQATKDAELTKSIEDLRELQAHDDNIEEQLKGKLTQQFINLFESKVTNKDLLNEAATALKSSLKLKDALDVLESSMPPKDFKSFDIQNKIQNDEGLARILVEIENEKKRTSSTDKALLIMTDFVIEQLNLINSKISSDKIKKIKRKISESFMTSRNIQNIFDDISKFIAESKFGLPADKVENIKQEALKSPSIVNLNNYLTTKAVMKSLFEKCQVDDDQLLADASYQFYETQNLEEALAPVKSQFSESYDRLLEAAYNDDDIERIVFEKIDQAPDSFMRKDYIRKAKERIPTFASQKVKFTLMIDLLEHIYNHGLHISLNLDKYQNEDRSVLESILKAIDKDPLRLEIEEIKVREELEKDLKEVVDLKPEPLKEVIEQILKKGLMNALLPEADNYLNNRSVNECLNKIVPYLQTKEIYKATKLYEKDLATWSAKADSLFVKLIEKVQNKEDSQTLNEVKSYLKNGSLDRDDIKEIKWVLMRIALENRYMEFRELIRQIFERDYATLKIYKELESSGEEKEVENLLKYQLKFNFQFKDLENYINEITLTNFGAGEELYKEQAAKYQDKNIELTKPQLLNYKEYIEKDNQILPVLVELEKSKRLYKKSKDQKVLEEVNKRIIPKLFGLNKDLYEIWNLKNKSEEFPIKDYEITSSEYALYPVEACNKAKKIASNVKFPNIKLNAFNVVTFRSSQEDQDLMIKNWIENTEEPEKFENLLPIYFNLLKRGEDWKTFVEKVSYHILDKKMSTKLGFFQRKFLFYLLLVSGDKELKARLLQLYGTYNPVPLRYPKWPIDPETGVIINKATESLEYEFNELIYYTIQPSLGILSLGLGNKASLPIGKSSILNKVFKKNFATAESSPFHVNTIDIDFDSSFRPHRQFCIADAHGNFSLKELQYFLALFKVLIVHIHAEDLSENKVETELETLCSIVSAQKQNNHVLILIRDDNLGEGYYEENQSNLKSKFPQLEPVFRLPENSISIASVRSMADINSNTESVINQKLQTTILGAVQLYKDERTVTKETFLKHLLKNLKNEDQHEIYKVDETLRSFLSEMKQYLNNFFDERAFPCRSYLSELRKVQKVLRTAKTDDELNKAKAAHSDLEKKLKSVKSTKLIQLFAEILRGENGYLVVMELSREIKDIVSANIKELMGTRDAILNEIKPKAANKDDPSNTDEAQRLKLMENQNKLKEINEAIDHRSLSIEVVWREMMALYNYNKQEVLTTLKIDSVQMIKEFLDKGEPFELIDGDNLQFNENVLKELFTTLKGKMCTVCVLGPQSSGKSTLLNYLFGCQFVSSVGRCTRGIYLSILKIHNNPNYEYLMILDTEGLQSVEKNDDEFDRKITLFCLAVSQIIIVNIKGDLHLPMKSLLEICTLSLHGLNMATIDQPTIYFVFNQNPPTKDKAPFMNQISSMMKEIIDANPEARDVAEILCPGDSNLHALGFAFQTSKEEKNTNKNIWQDWPYMQPQSSFANECATLSQIMYKTMNDRFQRATEAQKVFAEFREWSRMANDIWKTIDMFPSLLEFAAIRHMKQDRELRIHGNRLLESRIDRLNGEKVVADKIKSQAGLVNQKQSIAMMKNGHDSNFERNQIISDHYNIIKQEIRSELMTIREKEKYDYDLTRKHESHIIGRIEAYEQEALLLIKRDTLQIMLEVGKLQGLQGITDKIGDYLLDPEVSKSKEAAGNKFEELWSKNIEQGLNTFLNPDSHDKTLWTTIWSVYNKEAFLPDLGADRTRDLHDIINKDPQKRLDEAQELIPLIEKMTRMIKEDFGVRTEDKSDIFLKDIAIRYKQPTTYFSLASMLKQAILVYYFDITGIMNDSDVWWRWRTDVDILLYEKKQPKEAYYKRFESVMNSFAELGYFPTEQVMDAIHDKIYKPPVFFGNTQDEIKSLLLNYKEYSQLREKPSLFERKNRPSFANKHNIPGSKYWKIDILEEEFPAKNAEQNAGLIANLEQNYPNHCIVKNYSSRFAPIDNTYAMGLRFCIDPFDRSVPMITALRELREMILTKTEWSNLLRDIFENIMKEINVNAESLAKEPSLKRISSGAGDEESYYRDISSFSVDLVKNVVKKVDQKLEEYNKEILRCAHKLDMNGMKKIHFFALLIIWKTLCFASRKRLMEPVAKIMKEKEKWKNYFVSSVNNNSHEKSASFAERILIEYLAKLKHKIITDEIKPKALTNLEAAKGEFNVANVQKTLDDMYLLSKNSEDVREYVIGQVRFYEDYFDQLWLRHYCPLLDELKKSFRTNITQELGLVLQSIKKLKNFFKTVHQKEMGPAPLEIFEIKDAKGSVLSFQQNMQIEELSQDKTKEEILQICGRAQFVLFDDFFSSHIDEKWKYNEGQYSLTIKGLTGEFKADRKMNFAEEANLNKNENEISYLTVFLNSFELILNQEIHKIKSEELSWGYPDVGLDKVYQAYKNNSVGCTESCPTCGRKCDRVGSNHTHGCDSGHQIRGMFGIMRGDYLSSRTCDEIKPDAEIMIDKITKMKWADFVRQKFPTWDFTQVDKVKTQENIIKYRDCWKNHGNEFANYFAEIYGQKILAGFAQESEAYHFILALDGSGSMSGKPWDNAKKGATNFMAKLKQYEDSVSEIAVSIIVFNSGAQTHATYEGLNINLDQKLVYPGGGTAFDPPLQHALTLIQDERGTRFHRHFILFYTDGGAPYPTNAMNKIKAFAEKGKISFFALSEEANPAVLKTIVNEFQQFGTGELKPSVSPDMLVKELPEVLNSVFHKVD